MGGAFRPGGDLGKRAHYTAKELGATRESVTDADAG